MIKALGFLMAAVVATKSCTISVGGNSGAGSSGSPGLNVPWIAQVNSEYCGPASILMWALYDHVSNLTQDQIGSYIGASPTSGSSPTGILNGVHYFTISGRDAGIDYPGGSSDQIALYYSDEVTSINSQVPFIALIGGATHAGVASGGSWHHDDSSGYYVWDSVIFQDPIVGPNQPYIAGQWTSEDITHFVSLSASAGSNANLNTYGGQVALRGSRGRINGPLPI
jgi:hypothetical protein